MKPFVLSQLLLRHVVLVESQIQRFVVVSNFELTEQEQMPV